MSDRYPETELRNKRSCKHIELGIYFVWNEDFFSNSIRRSALNGKTSIFEFIPILWNHKGLPEVYQELLNVSLLNINNDAITHP